MSNTDPTNPTNPINPTEPTNPTNPTNPTEPVNPTEPIRPTEPIGPASPERDDPSRWFQTDAWPTTSATAAEPTTEPKRLPARFGTIFWGVLLLAFAGFMIVNAIVPVVLDPVTWLIGGLIAAGAVLVVAGIAAAVRRTG